MSGDALSQDPAQLRRRIDTTKAHPARVYDVFLGGKDNYPADRARRPTALAANPRGYLDVRHNRDFCVARSRLAREAGIRQFLDIGTGLPTAENVHEIAQRIAPTAGRLRRQRPGGSGPRARPAHQRSPRARPTTSTPTCATRDILRQAGGPSTSTSRSRWSSRRPALRRRTGRTTWCANCRRAAPGSQLVLSHLTEDLNPEKIRAVQDLCERGLTFELRSRDDVALLRGQRARPRRARRRARPPLASRRWRAGPEAVEAACSTPWDDIEKIRYRDINDVTDADVNVYGASGRRG